MRAAGNGCSLPFHAGKRRLLNAATLRFDFVTRNGASGDPE
jgi:hypothetical protein